MPARSRGSAAFAAVFAESLRARGVGLSWLHERLRERGYEISLTSLSYWRSSARTPSLESQRALIEDAEQLLDLPRGELARLAVKPYVPPRLPEPGMRFADAGGEFGDGAAVFDEATRVLGTASTDQFREVTLQQVSDIGPDGHLRTTVAQGVVQCVAGTVSRLMAGAASPMGFADHIELDVIGGGRVVDRYVSAQKMMMAVAVELDTPLQVGDTALLDIRVVYPPGSVSDYGVSVGVNRPARKLVNWVRFHPDALPRWFDEVETSADGDVRSSRALDTPTSIHQVRWDFGPGSIGLLWGYDEPERRPDAT